MELNVWTKRFHAIYEKAVGLYRNGQTGAETYFTPDETGFLASIGLRPIHVYDYAEDVIGGGEPDWETALLIVAVRRDFFLYVQNGQANPHAITSDDLPGRNEELGGIRWLPRLIRKAQGFLEGETCHDIMYCCGGDRGFFKRNGIHPADFLREIWSAKGDEQQILKFVQRHSQP